MSRIQSSSILRSLLSFCISGILFLHFPDESGPLSSLHKEKSKTQQCVWRTDSLNLRRSKSQRKFVLEVSDDDGFLVHLQPRRLPRFAVVQSVPFLNIVKLLK